MVEDNSEISLERQESIIKELCTSNGIQYHQIEGSGPCIKILEMFFSGFPSIVGLQYFPHLTKLVIVGQTLDCMQNLEYCPELKELWICETKLKEICGLEKNKRLNKLYLYNNSLSKIENISHLHNLDVLDLSKNFIRLIEGINGLKWLRNFNLAGNLIESVGTSFDTLLHLEFLNLSGNSLTSLKDVTNLARVSKLKDLILKDPLYPNNPICTLCNYSTYVLYHLPQLSKLDTFDVSSEQMRDLAEATVAKKKMYYNMRIKTAQRNLTSLLNRLNKERRLLLQLPEERLRSIFFAYKSIDQQQQQELPHKTDANQMDPEDSSNSETSKAVDAVQHVCGNGDKNKTNNLEIPDDGNAATNNRSTFSCKLQALEVRIGAWKAKINEIDTYHQQAVSLLTSLANTSVRRLVAELESGGNVRFEQGFPTDVWYTTCHDLILSRFCAWDYKAYNVTGIKIHGITRIHNRVLRARFDDKVHYMGSSDGSLPTSKHYKKLVDYLFYVWNPKSGAASQEFHTILVNGFPKSRNEDDCAIPLSNSLYVCEKPRMDHLLQEARETSHADPCPFRHGQVIISKVYLGKSAPAQGGSKISSDRYYGVDSVYRGRKDSITTTYVGKDDCDCSARQCEWFVFDRDLILPEYVVDFEYFGKRPISPFQLRVGEWMSGARMGANVAITTSTSGDPSALFSRDIAADAKVENMTPQLRPRPRLVALSDDMLLKLGNAVSLSQITMLNLHGNGLGRLKGINALSQLKQLVVSFNELSRLEDITHMTQLEKVDASFNKISSLEGMRGMSKLKDLNLSWNQLTSLRDDLTVLRKHAGQLNTLDLRNNPWIKAEYLYLRVIGRLKSLTSLNGTPVSETDAAAALRLVAGTRITQASLGMHSRSEKDVLKTLSLHTQAQILSSMSRNRPDLKDPSWMSKVTSLNLDGQYIGKLTGLEKLGSLRWASFNGNCITKLDGLECCLALEELSLQDNCIYKLDGIAKLTALRKVDLTSNYLSSLENVGLDTLNFLEYLSLENNRITSFRSLTGITSLVELYIGNNRVNNIREIFNLKGLTSLVILDLYGNPIIQSENYRLFVIFHLSFLKALDGSAIETSEEGSAKDAFGGRLTNDFVAEKIGHANFQEIKELDFPNSLIRTVDIGPAEIFKNLRSVNLEHNNLSSFSGLIHLRNLRVLCLNYNHVECIMPRPRNLKQQVKSQYAMNQQAAHELAPAESLNPVMECLEVLHLGYNKITNMAALQLSRLSNLKALFLQGNEVTKVEGIEGLHELRELVLDRNKIKLITDSSFVSQWNLQELHLEENRLRDLTHFHHLENLQRLYLGMNRIQDMLELEKLDALSNLVEISVIGNAVSRRLLHRPMLVYQQPNLQTIDGISVTPEERTKAELYFMDQQPIAAESVLPGITPHNRAGPIKVTHMPIGSERHVIPYAPGNYDDYGTKGFPSQASKVCKLMNKLNDSFKDTKKATDGVI